MKRRLMFSSMLLSSALTAQSAISYHYGQLTTESTQIMQIQSLGEIVGGNSPYHEIRYGANALEIGDVSKADVYLFGYTAPDKNNEVGFGIGGVMHGSLSPSIPKLTWKLGGNAGYGWQEVKGKSTMISTNINKLSYVTSMSGYESFKVPTKMTYDDDTYVLTLTLATGLSYDLNRNWRLDGDFAYRAAYYQFAYRNEGSGVLNSLTKQQDQWISTVGLSYRF